MLDLACAVHPRGYYPAPAGLFLGAHNDALDSGDPRREMNELGVGGHRELIPSAEHWRIREDRKFYLEGLRLPVGAPLKKSQVSEGRRSGGDRGACGGVCWRRQRRRLDAIAIKPTLTSAFDGWCSTVTTSANEQLDPLRVIYRPKRPMRSPRQRRLHSVS